MQIRTLDELAEEAARFIGTLHPKPDEATLVTLSGELGAGKTAFTKAVAKVLGVEGVLSSPTFVLEKIYELPEKALFRRLVHIDAYRLEGGSELAPLGFDEIMSDAGNLVFLEWPEKVTDGLPSPTVRISLAVGSGDERSITYG